MVGLVINSAASKDRSKVNYRQSWHLTAHIYHVMTIMMGGFSKKSFFINIIFIS